MIEAMKNVSNFKFFYKWTSMWFFGTSLVAPTLFKEWLSLLIENKENKQNKKKTIF